MTHPPVEASPSARAEPNIGTRLASARPVMSGVESGRASPRDTEYGVVLSPAKDLRLGALTVTVWWIVRGRGLRSFTSRWSFRMTRRGRPKLLCRPECNEGPRATGTDWHGMMAWAVAVARDPSLPLVVQPDPSSFYNSEIGPYRAERILL